MPIEKIEMHENLSGKVMQNFTSSSSKYHSHEQKNEIDMFFYHIIHKDRSNIM